jgi:hypothetical protein
MDKHEKGLEKQPGRLDQPLPEWKGRYGGDARRLPKVVQKLLAGRPLTAEEKAELLWRFFELDHRAREVRLKRRGWALALLVGLVAAYLAVFQRAWIADQIMAWLSPPAAPPTS